MNLNVLTEGNGRIEIGEDCGLISVRLVFDGAKANEIFFNIGPKDAIVVGNKMIEAGIHLIDKN